MFGGERKNFRILRALSMDTYALNYHKSNLSPQTARKFFIKKIDSARTRTYGHAINEKHRDSFDMAYLRRIT